MWAVFKCNLLLNILLCDFCTGIGYQNENWSTAVLYGWMAGRCVDTYLSNVLSPELQVALPIFVIRLISNVALWSLGDHITGTINQQFKQWINSHSLTAGLLQYTPNTWTMFGLFTEINLKNLWEKPQIGVSMSLKAWISMDLEITSSQWRIIEATSDQEPLEWDWYWWLHNQHLYMRNWRIYLAWLLYPRWTASIWCVAFANKHIVQVLWRQRRHNNSYLQTLQELRSPLHFIQGTEFYRSQASRILNLGKRFWFHQVWCCHMEIGLVLPVWIAVTHKFIPSNLKDGFHWLKYTVVQKAILQPSCNTNNLVHPKGNL